MSNANNHGLHIQVERQPWSNQLQLLVGQRSERSGDLVAVGQAVQMRQLDPAADAGAILEPTLKLRLDAGQQLMDELWRVGLRPSEGTGSAGALAAVQAHLKDVQAQAEHWRKAAERQQDAHGQLATILTANGQRVNDRMHALDRTLDALATTMGDATDEMARESLVHERMDDLAESVRDVLQLLRTMRSVDVAATVPA